MKKFKLVKHGNFYCLWETIWLANTKRAKELLNATKKYNKYKTLLSTFNLLSFTEEE